MKGPGVERLLCSPLDPDLSQAAPLFQIFDAPFVDLDQFQQVFD
jgi:hypothetical protein